MNIKTIIKHIRHMMSNGTMKTKIFPCSIFLLPDYAEKVIENIIFK